MLDKKDKIIFEHLLHDCRVPIKYLSKITHLSKPTISYRIKKLEEKGYISKYDAILDHKKFFKKTQVIFIQVKKSKEKEIEKKLLKNKDIASIICLIHEYNYLLMATTDNIDSLKKFLKKVTLKYRTYEIKQIEFFPFSVFEIPIKYEPKKIKKQIQTIKPLKLDNIDIKIIKVLSDGGARDSILEISRKTKIKPETVLYRFRRFKKENLFPWFVAQPGTQKFSLQNDVIKFKIKNLEHEEVMNKIGMIKKCAWLARIGKDVYITQILTTNFKEYKETLESIHNIFQDDLVKSEIYNTKGLLKINEYNFDDLK